MILERIAWKDSRESRVDNSISLGSPPSSRKISELWLADIFGKELRERSSMLVEAMSFEPMNQFLTFLSYDLLSILIAGFRVTPDAI